MNILISGAKVFYHGAFIKADLFISDGIVSAIGYNLSVDENTRIIDCRNYYVFPGFADVHVHLREPGFSYKETIKNGSLAGAKSGYTALCLMPNLNPAPDCPENIRIQQDIIDRDAVIDCFPYATLTNGRKGGGEITDFEALKKLSIGFTDDGTGIQQFEDMDLIMQKGAAAKVMIAAHCEDQSMINSGYIHDGEYARLHNHKGICSESEYTQVERDIELCKKYGTRYHVCHISCAETVEIIRKAKADGVNVTCETAPHYLTMCDMDIEEDGRFKMNPPIRSAHDRDELVKGIIDGTIDMISTDHAPHSAQEKSGGLKDSLMGVVGLETAFGVMYTEFVKKGIITLEHLVKIMSLNPRRRFRLPQAQIEKGAKANICIFDLDAHYTINSQDFISTAKSTPFEGKEVYGRNMMTILGDEIVWKGTDK